MSCGLPGNEGREGSRAVTALRVTWVVVQVDLCPEHVLTLTMDTLYSILKKPGVKKKPFQVLHRLAPSNGRFFRYSSVLARLSSIIRNCFNLLYGIFCI